MQVPNCTQYKEQRNMLNDTLEYMQCAKSRLQKILQISRFPVGEKTLEGHNIFENKKNKH